MYVINNYYYDHDLWYTANSRLILTPDTVHSCPGETVTFTCAVSDGDRLYWEVDYSDPSWSDVSTLRYSVTDNQGKIIPHTNNVGHTFKFNLTDNTHLTSTATTAVVQEMYGTKIYCRDAVKNQANAVIYDSGMNLK